MRGCLFLGELLVKKNEKGREEDLLVLLSIRIKNDTDLLLRLFFRPTSKGVGFYVREILEEDS